jgi:2,4-dienoyl-CoA reductase (NADPH2)
MDGPRVRTPIQVLREARPAPGHVLIVDEIGSHQATSLAEYLADGGCRISLVTSAFAAGQDLGVTLDLELWHQRMGGRVAFYPGHIVLDVREDPLLLDVWSNRQTVLHDVSLIVPVQHGRSRDDLFHALAGKAGQVLRAGDALAPKDVGEAILDGHRAARLACGMELNWQ